MKPNQTEVPSTSTNPPETDDNNSNGPTVEQNQGGFVSVGTGEPPQTDYDIYDEVDEVKNKN